jgi:CRISPR/Cas system Type II protein with McrA/HNH and RuvC-like nuclease domain
MSNPIGITAETQKVLRLYTRQGGNCIYTGLPLLPFILAKQVNLDHIQPKSKGGVDAEHNLALAPVWVNQLKGDMGQEDFVEFLRANKLPIIRPIE